MGPIMVSLTAEFLLPLGNLSFSLKVFQMIV